MTNLVSDAVDLIPWGSAHLLGSLDVPHMTPPTKSSTIGLKTITSPNAELGQKGFPRSSVMLCL
jgi:hypothetical protein